MKNLTCNDPFRYAVDLAVECFRGLPPARRLSPRSCRSRDSVRLSIAACLLHSGEQYRLFDLALSPRINVLLSPHHWHCLNTAYSPRPRLPSRRHESHQRRVRRSVANRDPQQRHTTSVAAIPRGTTPSFRFRSSACFVRLLREHPAHLHLSLRTCVIKIPQSLQGLFITYPVTR